MSLIALLPDSISSAFLSVTFLVSTSRKLCVDLSRYFSFYRDALLEGMKGEPERDQRSSHLATILLRMIKIAE